MEHNLIKTEATDFVRDQSTMAVININIRKLNELRARRDADVKTNIKINLLEEQVNRITEYLERETNVITNS